MLDVAASNDLRNGGDRNGFCFFCRSGLLLVRLAGATCLHKFVRTIVGLEADRAASDDCGASDTNQNIVVNPRTLEIVEIIDV
jgi:hypothetical protein